MLGRVVIEIVINLQCDIYNVLSGLRCAGRFTNYLILFYRYRHRKYFVMDWALLKTTT